MLRKAVETMVSRKAEATNAAKPKVMACNMQNEFELNASRIRAVSGPTEHSSYVKGNWSVECCFRG